MIESHQQLASSSSTNNKVSLIKGGKQYFALLLTLIEEAKECIHLQTYIFSDDETGHIISSALLTAVKRNVNVYLLADGYASQSLPQKFIKELKDAGIHFRYFEPLLKSKFFYFGRRMHHKVFVVDSKYAVVGGVNISNRYNDLPEQPAWLDFAVYVEGEIAKQLCILCWKTWKDFPLKMAKTSCEEKEISFNFPPEEKSIVSMHRNDWVRRKNEISRSYINMLRYAETHITILCSYFLPGKVIRQLLKKAAKRGVKIRVITAGRSDVMLSKHAERWLYDWLLRNKISLYEYQPTVLHAKIAVCDSEWLTVGSYNINNLSAYASIELNLDVRNTDLALETEKVLQSIIQKDCVPITPDEHVKHKNIFIQLKRWGSYQILRIVLFMLTFYYQQRK